MPMSSDVNELYPFPYVKIARNKNNFEEEIKKLEAYTGLFEFNVCNPPWLVQEGTPFHVVPPRYTISGTCDLPPGYELAYVPSTAVVEPLSIAERLRFNGQDPQNISSIYSFGPPLIALIQIVYASVTIYQSRGNQVDTYGYAAFGFTVIPYLIMSTVNLLGNIVTHSYPSIYLVHTELMDEASHRGGIFAGVVATLKSEPLSVNNMFVFSGLCQRRQGYLWEFEVGKLYRPGEIEPDGPMERRPRNFSYPIRATGNGISDAVAPSSSESLSSQDEEAKSRLIIVCPTCYNFKVRFTRLLPPQVSTPAMFISSLPLVAIGALSHFKAGSSTVAQRVWILGSTVLRMVNVTNPMFADWIIRTTIDNPALAKLRGLNLADPREEKYFYLDFGLFFLLILLLCVITAPTIGQFVVVGQMLNEYGSCSQLQKLGV
ncbi:uncharacterized protein N7446_000542 [Penicillium canescens]|uniref:Uncharacterized protein n=1 Tax=Penicillium canescens TaxID=5083 RepID=A0AAD6I4Y9_PENCN|nr:uncharacterized protein N7446_000542 [Penicillium canescens]KAJ6030396.1 hypothetical protein N7460_010662 [Penicillium canescens]KAJ6060770.1 hypothetical protein N7444_002624 [Penicillium canescens]KAJ6077606.1 hypothetical protein N7446_000542 [Penicillium canescens]